MPSGIPRDEALEKKDRIDEMKKIKKQPTRPAPAQAQQAPALLYAKVVGRPGTGSYTAPSPDPTTHPTTWTQSLVITLPKKGNLQLCQDYRTISHPSKVMLKIILNRDSSHKQKRSLQKSKQVSEQEGAPQIKYSISGSSARNTCSTNKMYTMS